MTSPPHLPGWYPEPGDPQLMREWDGEKWTENTMTKAAYAAFAQKETPPTAVPARPRPPVAQEKKEESKNDLPTFDAILKGAVDEDINPTPNLPVLPPGYEIEEYTGEEETTVTDGENTIRKGEKPEGGVIRSAGILDDNPLADPIVWAAMLISIPLAFMLGQRAHFVPALDGIVGISITVFATLAIMVTPGFLRMLRRNTQAALLVGQSASSGWNPDPTKISQERYSDGNWTRYVRPAPSGRYASILLTFLLTSSSFLVGNALPDIGLVSTFSKPDSQEVPESIESFLSAWWSGLGEEQKQLTCDRYLQAPDTEADVKAAALYSEAYFSYSDIANDPYLTVGNLSVGLENLFETACLERQDDAL